jgi:hypothetical protein
LDQMSTGIALITMIALALGYWKDRRTLKVSTGVTTATSSFTNAAIVASLSE